MKRVFVIAATVLGLALGASAAESKTITKKEARELVNKAATPADHLKLAAYYKSEAKKFEADAEEHAGMAAGYRAAPRPSEVKLPGATDTVVHCDSISKNLKEAAVEARALAADHEAMAK
jgi:hypothetical protein